MLLDGLGAGALPYCMILVGLVVLVASPAFSAMAKSHPAPVVMRGLSTVTLALFGSFAVLFYSGVAAHFSTVVYPAFFVCEEVLVTLLVVTFWQISMKTFTPPEAKRLIGIVSMGAAAANVFNGLIVGLVVDLSPRGAYDVLPFQCLLLLLQFIPNELCAHLYIPQTQEAPPQRISRKSRRSRWQETSKDDAQPAAKEESTPWYAHAVSQFLALWAFMIVVLFSFIEFQYNAVLAANMDADGIAKTTANLASVAGFWQTAVNLVLTPTLLQMSDGVRWALLVTPAAYACGEVAILFRQSVPSVFFARSLDFTFRYTINDSTKQIVFGAVPPAQLMEARTFIDGTLKKLAPAVVGALLIGAQRLVGGDVMLLVWPFAIVALTGALGLGPLCWHLANVYNSKVAGVQEAAAPVSKPEGAAPTGEQGQAESVERSMGRYSMVDEAAPSNEVPRSKSMSRYSMVNDYELLQDEPSDDDMGNDDDDLEAVNEPSARKDEQQGLTTAERPGIRPTPAIAAKAAKAKEGAAGLSA